jgi:formylglycine-generating enzyme
MEMATEIPARQTANRVAARLAAVLASSMLASAASAAPLGKAGASFRDCQEVCPEMVVVPPGRFLMGSPPNDLHQNAEGQERPQHAVTIAHAFAVGKFEVTRDEYAAFVRETHLADPDGCNVHEPPRWPTIRGLNWHNTGFPQTGRDPVVCVSWQETQAYLKWLSQKAGHPYRLLTEAEWEYADRAGTTTQAYWGDDPATACKYANGVDATLTERFPEVPWQEVIPCRDGYAFTAPVGSFAPNGFGLYDMEGNVFEWVEDCWVESFERAPADGSARTDGDCTKRVNRGGSWTSNPTGLRAAHRDEDHFEKTRVVDLGFRVARD